MDESINLELNNNDDNLLDITFNGLNNNLLDSPSISSRSPKREKRLRNKPPIKRPDVFVINEDDEPDDDRVQPPLARTQSSTSMTS